MISHIPSMLWAVLSGLCMVTAIAKYPAGPAKLPEYYVSYMAQTGEFSSVTGSMLLLIPGQIDSARISETCELIKAQLAKDGKTVTGSIVIYSFTPTGMVVPNGGKGT